MIYEHDICPASATPPVVQVTRVLRWEFPVTVSRCLYVWYVRCLAHWQSRLRKNGGLFVCERFDLSNIGQLTFDWAFLVLNSEAEAPMGWNYS